MNRAPINSILKESLKSRKETPRAKLARAGPPSPAYRKTCSTVSGIGIASVRTNKPATVAQMIGVANAALIEEAFSPPVMIKTPIVNIAKD